MFEFEQGFTHAGNFHADDVFSSAFLKILNPNIKILRGFTVPDNFKGIVFDIGGGEFDHHSSNREQREDGTFYASFGKLWRKFSSLIVSEFVAEKMDLYFIKYIDDADNTSKSDSLSFMIYDMNGFWSESEDMQNERFEDAVKVAKKILLRKIEKYKSVESAQKYVLEKYENSKNGIVILEQYAPWMDILKDKPVKGIIFPSNRGGYIVERIEDSGFEFPKEWWGKSLKELKECAKGLTFCHASGFMCVFDTMSNAIKAVNDIIEKG